MPFWQKCCSSPVSSESTLRWIDFTPRVANILPQLTALFRRQALYRTHTVLASAAIPRLLVAAAAGVFRDIPAGETWGGVPGQPIRRWMREVAWLSRSANRKGTDK